MINRNFVTYGATTWTFGFAAATSANGAATATTTGSVGQDEALYGNGGSTLVGGGGGGDYTFYLGATDTAVAGVGDGVDTEVSYYGNLTLAANVQNGVLEGAGTLTGNTLNNILTASATSPDTLVAGTGSALLVGSTTAADRFVIGQGSAPDAIQNFLHGSDILELDGFSTFAGPSGFSALKADLSQQGSNVVLTAGTQTVTFANQTVAQFSAADFALPFSTAGLKQTFGDEFNTFNASNSGYGTVWKTDNTGNINPGQKQVQYFANQNAPVDPYSVVNGVLNITAAPGPNPAGAQYNSGEITTQKSFAQTYGYFETRAELPAGAGMWPAFWLLPANGSAPSELDAPEQFGNNPNTLYFSTHSANQATQTVTAQVANTSQAFHTYGVDWEPTTITYYFDGNAVASLATPADMNQPMYMLLDLAVTGAGGAAGANTGETGVMQVDYVHAFATAATTGISNVIGQPIVVNGSGQSVVLGDGQYTVSGNAASSTVSLGNGAQTVALSGGNDRVTTGSGNQAIALGGSGNVVSTGVGASTIDGGGNSATITVAGTSPGGTTQLSASGYGDRFTSTGAGNVTVSGTLGYAAVNLAAGNDSVTLGGSGNSVTVGAGTSTVATTGGSGNTIHAAGNDTVTVAGWSNILDAGPGTNVLNGGAGYDTFLLNGAGQGTSTVTGFSIWNSDVLNLGRTVAGLGVNPNLSNLGNFVTATVVGSNTDLTVTPPGAASSVFAVLAGVQTSVGTLLAHNAIKLS